MSTLQQQTQEAAFSFLKAGAFKYSMLTDIYVMGAEWAFNHDRWIKVEDQLPEEDRKKPGYSIGVWATDGEMQFTCRYYFPAGKWIAAFKKVTHWQPLPQPPKK